MKIWNLQVGEPKAFLNRSGGTARVGRAHAISLMFSRHGHQVTHFVGSFNHVERKLEKLPYNIELPSIHAQINYVILESTGYDRNVSFQRIKDHFHIAYSFKKFTEATEDKPDLIIASVPTIELALIAVMFAKKNNIRVVIDYRDLWPDIFLHHFLPNSPRLVGILAKFLPWFWMNKYIFRNASIVTTVGNGFSRHVENTYISSSKKQKIQTIYQSQRELLLTEKIVKKGSCVRFVWTGNIVEETDFLTLKKTIEILSKKRLNFEVWIAGSGSILEDEKAFFEQYDRYVNLLGWLNESQLITALNECDVGLLCYLDRIDFRMAIQNKVIDYLRSGLPIVGSVNGELHELAETENSDVYHLYEFGNSHSLVEVMEQFIQKGVSDDMRRNCIELYERKFSSKIVEKQWLSLLN